MKSNHKNFVHLVVSYTYSSFLVEFLSFITVFTKAANGQNILTHFALADTYCYVK